MSSYDKDALIALGIILTFFVISWAGFVWLITEVMK